jgi:hypothetical protein
VFSPEKKGKSSPAPTYCQKTATPPVAAESVIVTDAMSLNPATESGTSNSLLEILAITVYGGSSSFLSEHIAFRKSFRTAWCHTAGTTQGQPQLHLHRLEQTDWPSRPRLEKQLGRNAG